MVKFDEKLDIYNTPTHEIHSKLNEKGIGF